ncbi:3788_t:CDS:2 [Scutellospora calospora]|uniref:3788_t:CDS:1 n=1 Tax=Scutellospora calospora TaxID=85575 RepID=A0ACA9KDH5_9GLOM|nr:3788_t:CDS:2 [Scutellospora calospora]
METSTYIGCLYTKPVNEFLELEAKDKVKRFCIYNDYNDYENNDYKNTTNLEIIELSNLCDHIQQLLNEYSTQLNNSLENEPLFNFQCEIDILIFNKSAKEVAEK